MTSNALKLDDTPTSDGNVVLASTTLDVLNDETVRAVFTLNSDGIVTSSEIHFPPVPVNLPRSELKAIEALSKACSGRLSLSGLGTRRDIAVGVVAGKLVADAARELGKRSS